MVSVSEKIGTGKKLWYRKNLIPEKSLGIGIRKIWYRKKYRYRKNLVPEKQYRYRLKFWVPSHTAENKVIVLDFVKIYEVAAF